MKKMQPLTNAQQRLVEENISLRIPLPEASCLKAAQ